MKVAWHDDENHFPHRESSADQGSGIRLASRFGAAASSMAQGALAASSSPATGSGGATAPPEKEQTKEEKLASPCVVPRINSDSENSLATFFDVAVIRCLFISHWGEEGVFWALTYLNKR